MNNKKWFSTHNSLRLVLILASLSLSPFVLAGEVAPNPVVGSEGEFIEYTVTFPSSFYQVPDVAAKTDCESITGVVDATWYLRFGFRGIDGTASWGNDSSADLQFRNKNSGVNYGASNDGWWSCLSTPTLSDNYAFTNVGLRLHYDFGTEGAETAQFEYFDVLSGQVMAIADVTITDVLDPQVADLVAAGGGYLEGIEYNRNGAAYVFGGLGNEGPVSSTSYEISFRRSTNTTISTFDAEFDIVSAPALEGYGYYDFGYLVTFPEDLQATTPYWGFCIVNAGEEVATSNNCSEDQAYPLLNGPAAPSVCSVTPLSCNDSVSGNFYTDDCEKGPRGALVGDSFSGAAGYLAESFEFEGVAGQTVSVLADWLNSVDGYLYLENPFGVIEQANDDYLGFNGSLIGDHILLETGTYKIWATTYQQGQLGDFEISLTCDALPSGGMVSVDPVSYDVNESAGSASVTLTRSDGSAGVASVDYMTSAGTAVAGVDYSTASGVVNWADGDSGAKTVTITIIDDAETEAGETFTLDISNPLGEYNVSVGNSTATVTILPNDEPEPLPGTLRVDSGSITVDENGGTARVTVSRINGSDGEVSVFYSTSSATAVAGVDYATTSGTLVWANADNNTKFIDIPVIDDATHESTETFNLTISSPTGGANLANITATISILDDDPEEPVDVVISQFYASPNKIGEGEIVTLSWTTENATQCFGENGVGAWLGEKSLNASQSVALEAAGINTFALNCSNGQGDQANAQITVEVQGSNPDLLLESLTLNNPELGINESFTATAEIRNTGDAISAASLVRYYLSVNEAISVSDLEVGTDTLGTLTVGDSDTESTSIAAPSTAGSYWIAACVDPIEGEPDIINNCSAGVPLTVTSNGACSISSMSCGDISAASLSDLDCQAGPLGPGHFASSHSFEGGKDQAIILDVGWGIADGYLALQAPSGEILVANDDFGDSEHSRVEYILQQTGTYTAWLTTFESGTEPSFELSLTCPEESEANLAVSVLEGPPDELKVGQSFLVEYNVRNIGNGNAEASTLRYLLSTDPSLSRNDIELGSSAVSLLMPNSAVSQSGNLQMVAPGDYWFGACVDTVGGESLENNNCTEGQRVTVSATAECDLSNIETNQESLNTFSNSDCDQSPRGVAYASKAFTFEGFKNETISLDAEWDGFDGYLYIEGPDGKVVADSDDYFGMNASQIELELSKTGTYTAWATTYSPDTLGSFRISKGVLAVCGDELTAESIGADKDTMGNGEQVTVSTQLSYEGACGDGGSSEESLLKYYLSTNSRITAGDAEVGEDVIDAIQAGSTGEEHLLVKAPVTSGKYWVGACIGGAGDDCVVTEPIRVESTIQSIAFNSGLNDAWWNPNQPGQGILISIFPSTKLIFMAWFTYDTELTPSEVQANLADPGQRWMTAYGFYEGNSATLDIEMTSGGVFNSNNPPVNQVNDGTVHIQFTDCNIGSLQYNIPSIGQQGTIEIERVTLENLHLCESALSDNQQLQNAVSIDANPALVKTGSGTVLSWQAPSHMHCVSVGGSGQWAEGMELDSSGSRKVRISSKGKHNYGMSCTDKFDQGSKVQASAQVTAVTVEEDGAQRDEQKVLFNPGLNDAWYDPKTPGQGILMSVFPESEFVFLAWFTFDTERPDQDVPYKLGDPGHRWMTAYGEYDGSSALLKLELTKGGLFDSNQPATSSEDYGTLDISFESCSSGEMTYDIPSAGLRGTIPLARTVSEKIEECQSLDGIDDPIDVLKKPQQKSLLPNKCGAGYVWDFEWEEQNGYQSYQIEIRNGRSDEPVHKQLLTGIKLRLEKNEIVTDDYLTGWRWRVRGFIVSGSAITLGPWSEEWVFDVAPVGACN
jgi:hypothetical protein